MAESLRHTAVEYKNTQDVLQQRPELVIAMSRSQPELTHIPTYKWRFDPPVHFDALRQLGQRTNTRLLEAEQVAHDCGLSERDLTDLVLPSTTADGQPAPALKLGPPRVTALLQALWLFAVPPPGSLAASSAPTSPSSRASHPSGTPRARWATTSVASSARGCFVASGVGSATRSRPPVGASRSSSRSS